MRSLFLISILFLTSPIFAQTNCKSDLEQKLQAIKTYQSPFTQKVLNQDGAVTQQSKGRVLIKNPGHFRWMIDPPEEQILQVNSKEFIQYSPGLKQETISPISSLGSQVPSWIFTGSAEALKDYKVISCADDQFVLKPIHEQGSPISSVTLIFNNKVLSEFSIEANQQFTTTFFTDPRLNQTIPDNAFDIPLSKDTDVINNFPQ